MRIQKTLNAFIILILTAVLLGAYGVQFLAHETPCPLCMLQRLCMLAVATTCMCNIRFGIHMSHYGMMIVASFLGAGVALRQISLHVCPGEHRFGIPILGLSLYTWSFLVFACCILAVALLLFLYHPSQEQKTSEALNRWAFICFVLIFFVCFANVITTFLQCGFGPCQD